MTGLEHAARIVCSSTWSMQIRSGLQPGIIAEHVEDHPGPLILVRQVRGVDQDELLESAAARSRWSRKTVASFFVFLFSPISPIPSTLGLVEKFGIS